MAIINLTPHPVNVVGEGGEVVATFPPSGQVLRLPEVTEAAGAVCGVPLVIKRLDAAASLPSAREGTFFIVSLPVAQAVRRPDFLVPDDLVRDEVGRVVGCRRFAVVS